MSSPSSSRTEEATNPSCSVNVISAKEDFTSSREDDFLSVFSCPVCLGLYVDPKILPKCGHSFCFKCIEAIVKNSSEKSNIICPECRAESSLGYRGVEQLQTNVQIQRAVEFVKDSAQNSAKKSDPDDICPHLALIKTPAKCSHCQKSFCQSCFFRHMERVRVEIAWVGSGFEERWKKAVEKLAANADSITSSIEQQVKKAESKIDEEMTALEEAVKEAIRHKRKRLLDKAREIGDEQLSKVRRMVETAKDTPEVLKIKIQKVCNSSVLHCNTRELSKLYTKVAERDKEIADLEELQSVPLFGQLNFETDQHLKEVVKQIDGSGDNSLNWILGGGDDSQKSEDTPTEIVRYHNAIKQGDLQTAKDMLQRLPPACVVYAIDHKDENDFKQTPLMQAAEFGHLEVVKFFVQEKKANLYCRNNEEKLSLAIHLAAEEGHLEVVRYFLECQADLLEAVDDFGNTPLSRAVMTGQMNVVKYLVEEKGADIDAKGERGRTPLLLACENGQLEITKFLLEKKADVDAVDTVNQGGALFVAAEYGKIDIIRHLLSVKPDILSEVTATGNSVLHLAVEKNQLDTVRFCLSEAKLDINLKNKEKMTALMIAVAKGYLEMVKFLLENGADVFVKCEDDSQNLAIHLAAKNGHEEVAAALLDFKPELADMKNGSYKTPIAVAKSAGKENILRLLSARAAKLTL